jgi:hypothetical protein
MNKAQIIAVSIICLTAASYGGDRGQEKTISAETNIQPMVRMDDAKFKAWLSRWQSNILGNVRNSYCSKDMGEDMGWLMLPMLKGFYYGYMATRNLQWVDLLVSCTESWIGRSVVEPDGYIGWPKIGAAGTNIDHLDEFYADSMLGEAMVLRYVVLMSDQMLKTPSLAEKYSARAKSYIKLAEQVFEKWDKRGAWRDTAGGGMITVELPFGIDKKTGAWTDSFEKRNAPDLGFSHPDNKANMIACWLLAMFDVTEKPIYKERAEKWFRVMKSRMRLNDDGAFRIWKYWEPAGAWDFKAAILPKHWVGVHPNAGYYEIDVESIVTAYDHGVVFDRRDISNLVKTALADTRNWFALAPYNNAIQKEFEDHNNPNSWSGLGITPWYLALQTRLYPMGDGLAR